MKNKKYNVYFNCPNNSCKISDQYWCNGEEIIVPLDDYLVKGLGYVIPTVLCAKCLSVLKFCIYLCDKG